MSAALEGPPLDKRNGLAQAVHIQAQHFGIRRTLNYLSRHYYWPGMSHTVKTVISACNTCQLVNRELIQPREINPIPVLGLMHRWHVDLVGELPKTLI